MKTLNAADRGGFLSYLSFDIASSIIEKIDDVVKGFLMNPKAPSAKAKLISSSTT